MVNDNKLKKIKDEATILSLLFGAKDKNCEVFIWKLIGSKKHLGQIKIDAIRKARKDFCISPIKGQETQVQDLLQNQGYVDIYIPDSALILRCHIKQSDAPVRYYVHLPEFVAQVERRKSFRLNDYENGDFKVNFMKSVISPRPMNQHFHKGCFDISTGGFSFFISRMESKFFKINDSIEIVQLNTGTWTTFVSAEIATIREVEPDEYNGFPYKVWRVSCRFSKIDQISRKYLEKYIFERIKSELHAINQ